MTHPTLLAHVVSQFASRRWEDVATEALLYLLKRPGVDRAFANALEPAQVVLPERLSWRTQALDADDPSRPDLVGNDERDRHVIIVESKFWAGLTENQPSTYLQRQQRQFQNDDVRTALVFLCPERRVDSLAAELEHRLKQAPTARGGLTVFADQGSTVVLVSWGRLLAALDGVLSQADDRDGLADLAQLRGLCDRADAEAMLPLEAHDVDGEHARRYVQFCDVVDAVTDRLKKEHLLDTKGLKATATKSWYARYVRSETGHVFRIYVNAKAWGHTYPSPWWLRFWSGGDAILQPLLQLRSDGVLPYVEVGESGNVLAALRPPLHVEYERIVEMLTEQIRRVCQVLPAASAAAVPADALEDGPTPEE